MVGTNALRQRAANVAMLVASRELVALRLDSKTHSALVIERNLLRNDFHFLGGRAPKVKQLFRGNSVELLLERGRLAAEAKRVEVVVAPWKFFDEGPATMKWHRFFSAQLTVAATLKEQLAQVRHDGQRRDLEAAADDPSLAFPAARTRKDFNRFYAQLYAPFTRQTLGAPVEPREEVARDFNDGGALVLATRKGKLIAGALLITQRRNGLLFQKAGFAQTGSLTPRQLAARIAALDIAVFRYAQEHRFAWIDFGETSSVLSDPDFSNRRQLGCNLVPMPSSPALMLEVAPKIRPTLFGATPLLTGEPGGFVARCGFSRGGKGHPRLARQYAGELVGAGVRSISFCTDAVRDAPGRVGQERVFREHAAEVELEIEEVRPPRPSAR
jgi:hypothetical protein